MLEERRAHPRTHYIHRISYTTQERIVGTFVLVAVFILIGLLLSSGKTKNIFEEYITIYGELKNIQTINKDTEVTISGLSAGTVSSVDITDDNKVILTMKILKKYQNLLREDSSAKLSGVNIAVVQKSVIEISAGSPDKALLADGSTLVVEEAFNIKELIDNIGPIFTALEESILKMNRVLAEIDTKQIGSTMGSVQAIASDIEEISAHMNQGKGLIGQAIYDEEFKNSIITTTQNMELASIKINLLLDDIKLQVQNVPELLEKIGPLLNEADKTLKGAQQIWPISSTIKKDESRETLVSPKPAND